ncbi:MAG: hypothetical protein OXH00_02360 [Candidatus Poribacteria bacterium]|nr:hypothetical protein [Candidatus Poribacteria bacterium]
MNSKTTSSFRDMLATLPRQIRQSARETYTLFNLNPNHPSLQFKKVHNTRPIYSVRINVDYRAVGEIDENDIIWFWIGPHREYEKLLRRI